MSSSTQAIADTTQRLTGIDLSHHNTVSDWSAITSAELSFVILKATDGMDYLDPTFADRFETLGTLGLVRGAYHFYETNDAPEVQASWFIENVGLRAGDLPPVVDIERVKAPVREGLQDEFKVFLDMLEDHYGMKPIIYTGPDFWTHVMKEHLPHYPLWIAQYGVDTPEIPDGWGNWTLWQYTDAHVVPGINGETDGNHFNGGIDDLRSVLLIDG
ncbi:glycoside hydrolase family 25 protein [Marivita hallyeonensis]|nr:GH25 family lysozyme [Marivita hallyeonensis]